MARGDDLEQLATYFRWFAESECSELPVYRQLVAGAAEDHQLLAMLQVAEPGQRRPNLILAAVHDLLLAGIPGDIAAWYPTVNGGAAPPGSDPYPAFRRFVDEHRTEIDERLATRSTQTNEVNRSCLWFAAVRAAAADRPGQPLTIVEVGASAGLNLRFDRYAIRFNQRLLGAHDSTVTLATTVNGTPPLDGTLPTIIERVGLDRQPVDVGDDEATRWLEACLWSEQLHRHVRFRAAVAEAKLDPPRVVRGDAVDDLESLVATTDASSHLIVLNSWVLTYLSRDQRSAYLDALNRIGSSRSMTWISAEHPTCLASFIDPTPADASPRAAGHTLVGMRRWRDGQATTPQSIASVHPHLRWMRWFDVTG